MSRYAENVDFSHSEKTNAENAADKLRFIERQFKWNGDDWHFALLHHVDEPIQVYAWFRDAKKVGEKIYFNGGSKWGCCAYEWVKTKLIGNLLKAFGKVEIVLANEGEVIKSFNPLEKKKINPKIAQIVEAVA